MLLRRPGSLAHPLAAMIAAAVTRALLYAPPRGGNSRAASERRRGAAPLAAHAVDEAIELTDRVAALDEGRIIAELAIDLPSEPLRRRREIFLEPPRRRLPADLGVTLKSRKPA